MVLLIVWLTDPELPLKFESPLYVAVTISDPTGRVEYVQVAIPPLSVTPLHMAVLPLVKVTVPVGVPELCEVTEALNVTVCPKAEGFDEEAIVVVEPSRLPILATKASPFAQLFALLQVVWKALGVTGKSVEVVRPVT